MLQSLAKYIETYPVRKKICDVSAYNLSAPIIRPSGTKNFDGVVIPIKLPFKFNTIFQNRCLRDWKEDG